MHFKQILAVLSTSIFACTLANVQPQSPPTSPETLFADIKTVTIYDSLSVRRPFELRERGTVTYSISNRTGSFSESGVLSRPHDGASTVYRIGTEDRMGMFLHPNALTADDAPVNEYLTLYLASDGELYHTSFFMEAATAQPGTFHVKVDHLADHTGPQVHLKARGGGSKTAKDTSADHSHESSQFAGEEQAEQEEEVPEKNLVQKYWIYAVPLVLLLLLSGGQEQ